MSDDVFDCIVVGAGIAGAVCAYRLAQAGREVVLIERASTPGSKNLSGGVFWCRVMDEVFPGFAEVAPVERRITRHVVTLANESSTVSLDYWDARLGEPVNAVSVLRAKLDAWLVSQCEDAGVLVMPGVRVDGLLTEGDRVVGVRAGQDALRASVVVAADGVNSFLAREVGLRSAAEPRALALGVKSVIELAPAVIHERFRCTDGEGVAQTWAGDVTLGCPGGGFLYTNAGSVSAGVVVRLDELVTRELTSSEVHDHFLAHPAVAPLLAGGTLIEYGAHLTVEDGPRSARQPCVAPGLLVIGEAAGLTLNTGIAVRGMDLAAQSAITAAATIDAALAAGDVSQASLGAYRTALDASFAGADLALHAGLPDFFDSERLYGPYGRLAADVLFGLYGHNAQPRRRARVVAHDAWQASGLRLRDAMMDAWRGVRWW